MSSGKSDRIGSDRIGESVTAGSDGPQESGRLQHLRERAQAALSRGDAAAAPLGAAAQAEVGALIEELRVYQAELEIQNQELSAAQQRTESLRDRFTRLFTALPLPALVVDERGVVCEANREARRLFAIGGQAGGRSIHRLLTDRDDSALGRLLETVRHADEPRSSLHSVGFRTVESDDHPFLVHAIAVHDDGQMPQVELLLVDQTGPKKIEAQRLALERQTERFLRAQQAADIGTWEWNVVADRIVWDATALGLLGLQPEQAVFANTAWRAMVHPEDLPGIVEHYEAQAHADDRFDNEARYRHADGRWIWLHVTGRVLARDTSGAPTRLSGILRNIDAEQRAREAAEAANMRLQRFAERAPGAFHQVTRTADGRSRLTFAGGHFAEVFGVDAQAAIADDKTVRNRVDPNDLVALERAIDDAGRHEAVVQMEFRITDADGTQRWLETESSPEPLPDGSVLWHGFTRDVTQRRRLADAEREARQRLQLACEIADIGIWNWDLDTGHLAWDERMYRWYEVPAEVRETGLVYAFWRDRVHPDDLERIEGLLNASVIRGDGGSDVFRIVLPDDRLRVIHTAWRAERGPNGAAQRMVGVNRDVTELRRAEAALIIAKESAEAADAAKGRFLANVGHEVRTPLNAMLGLAGVLLEDPLTPRQRERIEKIRIAGSVLMETLNDILDQSKIEAGMMRIESAPLRIRALLQRCRDLFDVQAEARGVRLEVATADDVPAVLVGDPLRLQQALGNLVGNALKFTDCGEVRVEVTCADHDADAVTLRISVTDTGIGLTPEELEGLFAAFHQSDSSISRRYGGTGLGLSIVKRLAELMGGTAGALSTAGRGSTFWFTARLRIAPDDIVVEPPMVRGPRATLDAAAPETAPVAGPTPTGAVDLEALRPRLRVLERQLSAGRVDARATAAEIGKLLAGTRLQPRWTAIARAVTGFDFSAALDRLRALSEEEGWNPTQHPGH